MYFIILNNRMTQCDVKTKAQESFYYFNDIFLDY